MGHRKQYIKLCCFVSDAYRHVYQSDRLSKTKWEKNQPLCVILSRKESTEVLQVAMLAPLRRAALGVAGGARAFTSSISKLAGNASESGSRAPAPTTAEWDNLIEQLATEEEKKEVSSLKSQLFSMHQSLQPTTEVRLQSFLWTSCERPWWHDGDILTRIMSTLSPCELR
jgi:hypothetical protein